MLSEEQIKQIKSQLLEQINNLPEEQRASMKEQIEKLEGKEFEDFLVKNNLISPEGNQQGQNPFRMIVNGDLPTYKIGENPEALAVLEINPISRGHVIIIPKKPYNAKEIPEDISRFSQLLAGHMKQKLNCKDIQIGVMEVVGEAIINILPVYEDETLNSERKQASEKELEEVQKEIFLPPLDDPNATPEPAKNKEVPKISTNEEPEQVEVEEEKPVEKKKRKTPINKLPKAPKRIP